MTREDWLALLRSHDHSRNPEHPDGFTEETYQACMARLALFTTDLEDAISSKLRLTHRSQIQDCSFYAELRLPLELVSGPQFLPKDKVPPQFAAASGLTVIYGLRFSKFGQMVDLGDETQILSRVAKSIKTLLNKYGYILVPSDVLALPYDGEFRFIPNWKVRYFDYI